MRISRSEAGEVMPDFIFRVMAVNFLVVLLVGVASIAGPRWAVAVAGMICVLVGAVWLWDRLAVARLPAPDPERLEELNGPDAAAGLAAALADFVVDVLGQARLEAEDRRCLEDLEQLLRAAAASRRWSAGSGARTWTWAPTSGQTW